MDEFNLSSVAAAAGNTGIGENGDTSHRIQFVNACHPAESGSVPPAASEESAPQPTPVSEEKEAMNASVDYRLIFTYAPYVPRKPNLPIPAEGLLGWYDSPPNFHGFFRLPMPERYWLRYKTYVCLWCIKTGKITVPVAIREQDFIFTREVNGIIRYKEPHEISSSQMMDMHFLATLAL